MKNSIIVPDDVSHLPEPHEMAVARLLSAYFKKDVTFIKRAYSKTADIKIGHTEWEIKSPTGSGKHNIQHKLQEAAKQSKNVVLDASRSKIHQKRFTAEAKHQFTIVRSIKRMIIIEKSKNIVDISR